jgi:hypothetical protein
MVLARIFAEITVLLILVLLPAILAITGHLQAAPLTAKFLIFALMLIAGLLLPAYAFVTWLVVIDKHGLTAMSLANHQRCEFHQMKRMSRRSNWNWVRYVIEHQQGELTFPIWLVNCEELVETVKQRIPGGGGVGSPFRKFRQDKISLLFQCMQAMLGIGLVVVFWIFFGELAHSKLSNQADLVIVLVFCLAITMIFLWRSTVIFLIPRSVELTPSGIIVDTMAFSRRIGWQNVLNLRPAMPLLPEGFMLKTAKGSFLIGNGMDSADELVSSIQSKLPPDPAVLKAIKNRSAKPAGQQGFLSPSAEVAKQTARESNQQVEEENEIGSASLESAASQEGSRASNDDLATTGNAGLTDVSPSAGEINSNESTEEAQSANAQQPAAGRKKSPSGKKADRRFRRGKKKN